MDRHDIRALLLDIHRTPGEDFTAYAIGGSALVLSGIQKVTKDIDLMFTGHTGRAAFVDRAIAFGFSCVEDPATGPADAAPDRSVTLIGPAQIILDCFLRRTTHFTVSASMLRRAMSLLEEGGGITQVIAPQDIFLLKSATGRPSDSKIVNSIAGQVSLDWGQLFETLQEQQSDGNDRVMYDMAALIAEGDLWVSVPKWFASQVINAVRDEMDRADRMIAEHCRR